MNTGMVLALVIGTLIPALTAGVSGLHASARLKAMLSAMLAAITGALSGALQQPPKALSQWEQIVLTIVLAWIAAGVSYAAGWKPTGGAAAISRLTSRVGFGRHSAA